MSFWTRIKAAFSRENPQSDMIQKSKGSKGLMLFLSGGAKDGKSQEAILKAYHNDPVLHVSLRTIAQSVASANLYVSRNGKRLESHDLLGILTRPNEYHSRYSFMTLLSLYLDLLGEVYLYLMKTSMGTEIIPISPTCITQEDDATYTITLGGTTIEGARIDKNLVRITSPDLREPYTSGLGFGSVLSQELDISEAAARHEAAFLQNSARPDMIINLPGQGDAETKAFSEAWNAKNKGPRQSGKASVMNASDINVQLLTQSFKDLGLVGIRTHNADLIRQSLGIPPEILGDVKNSNRATIEAADFLFKTNVITPRLTAIITELSIKLIPLLYPSERGLELGFDSVIPADKDFALRVIQASPESFTHNEVRSLAGDHYEAKEDGDQYLNRSHVSPSRTPEASKMASYSRPESRMVCGPLGSSAEEMYFKSLNLKKLSNELKELPS